MTDPSISWQQGYNDYGQNKSPQYSDNSEYMSGWVAGWGVTDAWCEQPPLFPQDSDYMSGYNIVQKSGGDRSSK